MRILILLLFPLTIFSQSIPLTLEIAQTEQKRAWGLMRRDQLPKNHGMLFIYEQPKYLSVWMFNCFIDLSVAFIGSQGYITEIHELKAYPEIMDPDRPVFTLKDLALYPPHDPITRFFQINGATSSKKVRYILEMEGGWFKKNGIFPGDRIIWKAGSNQATIELQNRTKIGMLIPKGD